MEREMIDGSGDKVEVTGSRDAVHRILVLAHEGLGGHALVEHLDGEASGRDAEVFVVVPALSGSVKQLANDDRDEIARAQADLERLIGEIVIVNPADDAIEGLEEASTERALKDVDLPVVVLTID